jgi:hypothetical protein
MAASTASIEITDVPAETLRLLDERIRRLGGDRAAYIRRLLEKDLRSPTLAELLAPFRAQVAQQGIEEAELDRLFEDAREEAFREARTRYE